VGESLCDGGGGRYCTVLVEFCLSGSDGKRLDEVRFVLKAASGSLVIYCILGTVPVTGILSAFVPSRWLETRRNVIPDWRDSDH